MAGQAPQPITQMPIESQQVKLPPCPVSSEQRMIRLPQVPQEGGNSFGPGTPVRSEEEIINQALAFRAERKGLYQQVGSCVQLREPYVQQIAQIRTWAAQKNESVADMPEFWVQRAFLHRIDRYSECRERSLAQSEETDRLLDIGFRMIQNGNRAQGVAFLDRALNQAPKKEPVRILRYIQPVSQEKLNTIRQIASLPQFCVTSSDFREHLLNVAMYQDEDRNRMLATLISSMQFYQFSDCEKNKLLSLFEVTHTQELPNLIGLMNPTDLSAKRTPRLLTKDLHPDPLRRQTLLDHLLSFRAMIDRGTVDCELQAPSLPGRGNDRSDMFSRFVRELDRPGESIQGNRGVCPVASLSEFVSRFYPAETARMAAGLLSSEGQSANRVLLHNNQCLTLAPDSLLNDNSSRTAFERVIQSAFMDLADGEAIKYSNVRDQHYQENAFADGSTWHRATGLFIEETARAVAAVLGQPQILFKNDGSRTLVNPDMTMYAREKELNMNISGTMRDVICYHAEQNKVGRVPKLVIAFVRWFDKPDPPGSDCHAIVIREVKQDANNEWRVYFRNPWGPHTPKAEELKEKGVPNYRVENRGEGLCSMTLDEFGQRTAAVLATLTPDECPGEVERARLVPAVAFPTDSG